MRVVADEGTGRERIVVIGEAPGAVEEATGRPFVGMAGHKLDDWLTHAGLQRSDCYITNVCAVRPPNNKLAALPKAEVARWTEALHQRLAKLADPWVLVPTGETALRALVAKRGITKHRGSIYEYEDRNGRRIKTIPTLHPAAILRQPGWERRCLRDWERIADDSTFRELRPPAREHLIRPTLDDLRWFCADVARKAEVLSIDIETPRTLTLVPQPPTKTGKERKPKRVKGERRITHVGFAADPWFSLTVPTTLEYWRDELSLRQAWGYIRALCALPTEKALCNGLFDTFWLADAGIDVAAWRWDVRWMHHCLDATDSHSLAYMASLDTRQPFWKDMKDSKDGDDDDEAYDTSSFDTFSRYNGLDAAVTRELTAVYHGRLDKEGRLAFYDHHYGDLYQPLLSLMRTGIWMDRDRCQTQRHRLGDECRTLRDQLAAAAGGPLHGPKGGLSPKKLQAFLYGTLKLPKRTKGGKVTAREVAIRQLMLRYPEKVGAAGALILELQRKRKLSEFLAEGIADPDGYVRPSYGFTYTGRLAASSNPKGTGRNTQNIDRELRGLYRPDPGCLLLEVDLSQAESRVVYARTGAPELVRLALTKPWEYDAHGDNATLIFKRPAAEITKDQRYLAKRGVHAGHYGMQGHKLSEVLLVDGYERTPDECQAMIDAYLDARPALRDWQRRTRIEILRERRLVNAWGRVVDFRYARFDDDLFRMGYAFRPQSEIADLLNQWGLIPLWRWLQASGRRSRINLQVHDSLVVSVPPDEAWAVLSFVREALERPWRCGSVDLTVPVEVKLGTTWRCEREWKKPPSREEFEAAVAELMRGDT